MRRISETFRHVPQVVIATSAHRPRGAGVAALRAGVDVGARRGALCGLLRLLLGLLFGHAAE